MPDKTEHKDLEMVLAKLKEEWRELADLLTSQGKSRDRVIEVEKILLRDASGQYRGKISADPGGSADLFLSDPAGNAWARLGVNQAGEAFLELKDRNGASSFKVAVGAPSPGAGAELTAAPAPQPLESPVASPLPIMMPKNSRCAGAMVVISATCGFTKPTKIAQFAEMVHAHFEHAIFGVARQRGERQAARPSDCCSWRRWHGCGPAHSGRYAGFPWWWSCRRCR